MSCPLNKNRWAGSGYVKQPETAEAKVMTSKVAAMEAERAAQDAKLFPPLAPASCAGGVCAKPSTAQQCAGGLCKKK